MWWPRVAAGLYSLVKANFYTSDLSDWYPDKSNHEDEIERNTNANYKKVKL